MSTAAVQHSLREPWNKGRLVGQKRPLKPKDVWNIRVRLQIKAGKRDLAMFNLAIDSKLRGCDLVRLKIEDVYANGRARDRATVVQKKTSRPVQFELTEQTRRSVEEWLAVVKGHDGRYLFPSRIHDQPHISTRQYARIVHSWVRSAGLDEISLWHPFNAANEGGANLQEDRKFEGGSASARTLEVGEHRPLPRHRGG